MVSEVVSWVRNLYLCPTSFVAPFAALTETGVGYVIFFVVALQKGVGRRTHEGSVTHDFSELP